MKSLLGIAVGLIAVGALLPEAMAAQSCPALAPIDNGEVTSDERVAEGCLYTVRIDDDFYATRSFLLLRPDAYDSAPDTRLVVDFHGTGSTKRGQFNASCWKGKAAEVGALVAYPNGTGFPRSFNAGEYCCNTKIGPALDDVAFTRRVVATVEALVSESATRIYASGLSNGGAMSHELACEANDLFDGVAPLSQTFTKRPGSVCIDSAETPIPVLDFRATDDLVIPYNGGLSLATAFTVNWLSAEESRQRWATELTCGPETTRLDFNAAGTSYCLRMEGCAADFVQCTIDGPHVAYTAANGDGLNVCDTAWEFFGEATPSRLP